MLILLLLTIIIFQTIIGMDNDPNPDVTISSCWESCPESPNKVCPKRCEYYLKAGKKICWKCFCKICIVKFGDIFQLNFEEGSSSNWQQNIGLDEGQSSSSSQIIPSLEEGQASSSQIIPLGNFLQSLKEQINSTILEQIQQLFSNGDILIE
ncbi:hypothetical protein Mgra_00003078 [Meloidogyne graminicola]|uniref:Uncharacterized protein n=1 Tax=Meloidogyne graminicola TaxID=189291 RepID=A0A8S9ZWB4_9BILA|nr:hypothetical protein Mgra_00003078 [Meloidogyne graminicola]